MDSDQNDSIVRVFNALSSHGAINYTSQGIRRAELNVNAFSHLQSYVDPIMGNLHTQLVTAKIKYDAITSIPTGGDAWAKSLVKIVKEKEGLEVPLYNLRKSGGEGFSILDGQSVGRRSRLLVIDDTIFMGETSSSAVEVLENADYKVVSLLFPVEIGTFGRRRWDKKGYPVFSVFNTPFIEANDL